MFMAVDMTVRTGTFYLNSIDQVKCMGVYSTGENDCYYNLTKGVLTNDGGFTNEIVATMTLVDGTTDIYKLESFKIDIGGEQFTPYYSIIPLEITGHSTSGAEYTLYGVIIVLAVVTLLIFGVRIITNRE